MAKRLSDKVKMRILLMRHSWLWYSCRCHAALLVPHPAAPSSRPGRRNSPCRENIPTARAIVARRYCGRGRDRHQWCARRRLSAVCLCRLCGYGRASAPAGCLRRGEMTRWCPIASSRKSCAENMLASYMRRCAWQCARADWRMPADSRRPSLRGARKARLA